MKRSVKLMLALLAVSAASVHAQDVRARVMRPAQGRGGDLRAATVYGAPMRRGGVESILRMKDELKLTDAQVSQLEAIRKEEVARRQEEARTRIDLESRIAAGLARPDNSRDQIVDRWSKAREEDEKSLERIEKILTEEQRDQLREERIQRVRGAMTRARVSMPRGELRRGFERKFAPRFRLPSSRSR